MVSMAQSISEDVIRWVKNTDPKDNESLKTNERISCRSSWKSYLKIKPKNI